MGACPLNNACTRPRPVQNWQVTAAVADMCVQLHTGVEAAAASFYAALRRRYYTTPKSYLDMISLYLQLLAAKRYVRVFVVASTHAWRSCVRRAARLLN